MDRIGYGEPYLLSEEEELELINEINFSLKEYEKHITENNLMDIPYEIIISGHKNILNMLKLYSKKEGLNNDNMYNSKIFRNIKLPNSLIKKFHKMRIIRNGVSHKGFEGGEISNFLVNFKEFINEFNEYYSKKYAVPKPFMIDSIYNIISFILLENNDSGEYNKQLSKTLETILEDDENFTEDYEKLKINGINKLIKILEKEIKNIENDSYYYNILLHGQKISESMLILYLEKMGYIKSYKKFIEESHYKYTANMKNIDYKNFMQILNFCDDINVLPKNVKNFLRTMQGYRNEGIHGAKPTYELIKTYLETLNYFLIWFNEFYPHSPNNNLFEITEISMLIQSLSQDDPNNDQFIKLNEESKYLEKQIEALNEKIGYLNNESSEVVEKYSENKQLNSELFDSYKPLSTTPQDIEKELDSLVNRLNEVKSRQSEVENVKIMKALEYLGKKLGILEKKIDEVSERTRRIEDKIDKILHKIDTKTDALQSFIANQIDNAHSQDEKEKIITEFINTHIENISQEYQYNVSKKEEYEKEKKKLIYLSLGEDGWNKLSKESKTFLITSKVMFNDLIMIDDITDYSGVCILITKALEVELFRRFYTDFIKYLKNKYGEDYDKYPSSLIHTNKKQEKSIIFENKFYMGTTVFLLNPKKDKFKKIHQIKHDEKVLLEYCKECIFSNKNTTEIKNTLYEYSNNIENIKDKYRNPSAHRNAIQRVNAQECLALVLDVEKLLKKMLDSFDY